MKRRPSVWKVLGVLAIVFVVAAVLFPVFFSAREGGGPHHSCLSNEKQLGLALIQYTYDYDELMPPVTHGVKNTWRVAVYNDVRSNGLYQCPDDDRAPGPDGHFPSYAMNTGATVSAPGTKPRTLSSAPQPQSLVLLCEVQNTTNADFDINTVPPAAHILAVRHSGGGNYLLADGHAKWFKPSAFTYIPPATGKTAQAIVRWNRDTKRPLSANEIAILADAQARAQ